MAQTSLCPPTKGPGMLGTCWATGDLLGHWSWGLAFTSTWVALQSPAETPGGSALTAGNPITA